MDKVIHDGFDQQFEHVLWRAQNAASLVRRTMAVCYLLLILGFKAKGGYKAASVDGGTLSPEEEEILATPA
ncbi:MAG: hypothetical protein R3C49_12080 [Planctomycetaceae bacterium]